MAKMGQKGYGMDTITKTCSKCGIKRPSIDFYSLDRKEGKLRPDWEYPLRRNHD